MSHAQEGASAASSSTAGANNRWPPQIKYIVGNEACERFSYYGMKGILALYIINVLQKTQDDATTIIALFSAINYLTPLLGAWVSDRYWGRYWTILSISLFYCLGHGVLATSDFMESTEGKVWALYIGLGLIAFGSGGIKPCVSAFMGDQFKPDQRHLLQKAYAAFYWSINLGSFFSFLIIPALRKNFGYSWAFGVPGVFMAIATLIFYLGTKHYVMVPPKRITKSTGFFRVLMEALRNRDKRRPGESFWDTAVPRYGQKDVDAAKSVGPILSIFALIPVFWALFDQTFSTWVIQGNQMVEFSIIRWRIGPEEMLSANPLFVMMLIPVMTLGLYPLLGRLATPLRRMSAGMFLAGVSYLVVAWLQSQLEAGAQLSILWQAAPYIILTIAEVLVSTTGLEFAFREAAAEMKSTIMAFWSLTVAAGNLLVVFITRALGSVGEADDGSVSTSRFLLYAGMTFVVAVLFSAIAARYRYRDESAALGR
jgi:proton-dependent oligopeptide transporter, POT family